MLRGKLLGGSVGFLVGGPLGAVLGAALGHGFDRGVPLQLGHDGGASTEPLTSGDAERVRTSFFTATFSVLGHVAELDGRIGRSEIACAEALMARMSLTPELGRAAVALFDEGRRAEFELEAAIVRFRDECARRSDLYRVFVEIQIQGALADGEMSPARERVLREVGSLLGFGDAAFRRIELLVRLGMGLGGAEAGGGGRTGSRTGGGASGVGRGAAGRARGAHGGARRRAGRAHARGANAGARGGARRGAGRPPRRSGRISVAESYALLGVGRDADRVAVKRAYRRLMSQHHPDKLVSKGLPEEMIRVATDRTQQVRQAWERIRGSRGW